ncbi:MAG: GTPase [Thaumarchaeota archaeon]|nr:MAG: GTPase [Nitrososphaerota archaeon]RLG05605.1 MAG: GTPase [Nitrososphaerota archaeon]
MNTVFIVGTAGSGKSTLTSAFSDWLRSQDWSTIIVNLDPAAQVLPYDPDVDVRDMVDYERIMATRKLGPNAALIASIREVARQAEELKEEVKSFNPDYILVDTPGQLELFAFRREGLILAENIGLKERKAMIFVLDPMFCTTVKNFVSSMFLSASVYFSFGIPLIHALNKIDAISREEVERIEGWSESFDSLLVDLENTARGRLRAFSREIAEALHDIIISMPIVPVSSVTMEGLSELHAMLTRFLLEEDLELR